MLILCYDFLFVDNHTYTSANFDPDINQPLHEFL